jgi:hypothetical protein
MDQPGDLRGASMRLDELEPSHLWVLGMAVDRPTRPARREQARPARREESDLPAWAAECTCLDWCARDHENE